MKRLFLVGSLLVMVWLSLPLSLLAQAPGVEEFALRLDEAANHLEAGDQARAEELLRSLRSVRTSDGEIELAPEGWATLLESSPSEAASTLRAAAASLRDPRAELPADARERLEQVLRRAEFQPAQPSLWERFVRWLLERFSGVPAVEGAGAAGDFLVLALQIISGVVVAGVLFLFLRGLRQNVVEGERVDALHGEIPLHANEAQQRASDAAGAGEYREAMRLLYLAALLHLDEVGLIRFNRALTNREVLASVSGNEPLRQLMSPVVAQFDRVWYGHAPFGQPDYEQVRGQIEQLRAMEPEQ